MRLSAKAIPSWCGVNMFAFGNQWIVRAGEPLSLYFQIVDLDQSGIRYIPGVGVGNTPVVVTVTFPSIDDAQVLAITATQADANDGSIWKIDLTENQVPKSGNVIFAIAEGSVTRRFSVLNLISVEQPTNDGCC